MTLAEWHAALNDFPPALFVASVVFDLWGVARRREALVAAGYWCLLAAGVTAVFALASGLLAEENVQQTAEVGRIVETHETLGIALTILLAGLAGWRVWRKNHFSEPERQSYTMVSIVGALAMLWLAHLGGTMVYRHAAGIPSDVLRTELRDRADTATRPAER
ncbi:MAG: DUF2231 domain-containing protein [Gemmatimonadetes bacterium]|nr:DUF2231 domain-containing protein [Gemmatimonadota bacterium]